MDINVIIVIIIIVIIAIIIIVGAARLNLANDLPANSEVADPSNINTGDILVVGYRNYRHWLTALWTGSVWSHTGIAWRHPVTGELFVLDSGRYKDDVTGLTSVNPVTPVTSVRRKLYDGIFRIPFDRWLHINRRQYIGHLKLRCSTTIDNKLVSAMDQVWARLEKCSKDSNTRWVYNVCSSPYTKPLYKGKYICYELSVILLQECGIMAKINHPSSYTPKALAGRHIEMMAGYTYEDPVLLTISI